MSSNVYHNPASRKPFSESMKRKVIKQKVEPISKLPKISSFLEVNQKQINNLNNHDGDGATADEMDQEPVEVLIPEPVEVLIPEPVEVLMPDEKLKKCGSEIVQATAKLSISCYHQIITAILTSTFMMHRLNSL